MGKRNRERIERIRAGLEEPRAAQIAKKMGRPLVEKELLKGTDEERINRLDSLVSTGDLKADKLRASIMDNAPAEMDKAIRKYQKEGKEISVDTLCHEVRTDLPFRTTCQRVGIPLSWFEDLARERMAKLGVIS